MTCNDFAHRVDDLLAGDGTARTTAALGRHADSCCACNKEWQRVDLIRRAPALPTSLALLTCVGPESGYAPRSTGRGIRRFGSEK